jgi:bacterioferritin-associated ferredoxin
MILRMPLIFSRPRRVQEEPFEMIVCVCRGITDRRILEEAAAGYTAEQVFERTGAGSSCGSCKFTIMRMVAAEHARAAIAAAKADETRRDAA